MRKFASLTLHKERRERAGATPRDPLSPTLSHGPSVSVQPATVIYHRSNLPGNSSHSAERSNEFVARWIVRLPASPWPRSDRIEEISSRTPEFRSCLQFDFNATCVNFPSSDLLLFLWESGWTSRRISFFLVSTRKFKTISTYLLVNDSFPLIFLLFLPDTSFELNRLDDKYSQNPLEFSHTLVLDQKNPWKKPLTSHHYSLESSPFHRWSSSRPVSYPRIKILVERGEKEEEAELASMAVI